jgi:hypothetical protein
MKGLRMGVRRLTAGSFCILSVCGVAGSAAGLAAVFDGKDADGVGDAGLEADAPVTNAEAALGEVAEDTHRGFTVDGAEVGAGVR